MLNLTEETVKDFIKQGKAVIKVYTDLDKCEPCKLYAPVFEEVAVDTDKVKFGQLWMSHPRDPKPIPSEFRRTYMKSDKGDVKHTVPATLVFENGELKTSAFGTLSKEHLTRLVETAEAPVQQPQKPTTLEEHLKTASVDQLKAHLWDLENEHKMFLAELHRRGR